MLNITLSSLAGGQGKSTTALFLGRLLVTHGYRVLLVDADPQASLTFYLGHEVSPTDPSLLEVLKGAIAPEQAIYPTEYAVSLIPADDGLNTAQEFLASSGMGAMFMRQRLQNVRGFDVCIIDSPPQGSQLSLTSLAAADQLLIPVEAGSKGVTSLIRTLDTVYKLQNFNFFNGQILGVVPFRDKWVGFSQTSCSREAIAAINRIAETHNLKVWPSILESEAYRKALDQGQTPKDFSASITHSLETIFSHLQQTCLIPALTTA